MESVATFIRGNRQCVGILNRPVNAKPIGVLFLHGWGTYRIGPHRIFVDVARALAECGYASYRFDFGGRGDSDGDASTTNLLDMIDDVPSAIDALCKHGVVDKVVLVGLCSGGEVAVGAAMNDPRIAGLSLWSTPLLGRQADVQTHVKQEAAKTAHHAKGYFRKALQPQTWRKLIKFQIHWGSIGQVLFGGYKTDAGPEMKEAELLKRFGDFSGRVQFIYGSKDPDAAGSQAAYEAVCSDSTMTTDVNTIIGANHNFYALSWKRDIIRHVSEWLDGFESADS